MPLHRWRAAGPRHDGGQKGCSKYVRFRRGPVSKNGGKESLRNSYLRTHLVNQNAEKR